MEYTSGDVMIYKFNKDLENIVYQGTIKGISKKLGMREGWGLASLYKNMLL